MRNKWYRISEEGVFGGVCAGLSHTTGISVYLVRALAILGLFMGFFIFTILVYLVLMLLLDDVPARMANSPDGNGYKNKLDESEIRLKRCQKKLNNIEEFIISSQYELEKQFKDLK